MSPRGRAALFCLLVIGFVCAGVANVLLGPALPLLTARWQLADAAAGSLFAAMFAGNVSGALLAPRRPAASIVTGAVAIAAGALLFAYSGARGALLALYVLGLGAGLLVTGGNLLAGELWPERRASRLSLLSACWSAGAILCPIALQFAVEQASLPVFLLGLAIAAVAVSGPLAAVAAAGGLFRQPAFALDRRETVRPRKGQWRHVALFALLLLLFVGVENAIGGWLPSLGRRFRAGSPPAVISRHTTLVASSYWAAEAVGRALVPVALLAMQEIRLYRTAVVLALCGVGVVMELPLILGQHGEGPALVGASIVCGLALAPVFPLTVSFLLGYAEDRSALGWVFASAAFGAVVLPWLTGVVSTGTDSLRAGFAVPATALALMLALSPRLQPSRNLAATLPGE